MKTVIVTGGAKGIGEAIVRNLSKEYNVLLNYKTSEKQAKQIQEELSTQGCNVEIYKADITKREEIKRMVEYCLKKFGDIDVLINNAGISQIKPFADIKEAEWEEMIETNLTSVYRVTQEVLGSMLKNKNGLIINISSIWGIKGASCEVHYSAAKAGINGLTKALAKELGLSNIRVNAIAPGIINTDMNKELKQEEMKEILEQIPLGKIGKAEEIAKCIKWLIEDKYTTGQIISIDGRLGNRIKNKDANFNKILKLASLFSNKSYYILYIICIKEKQ